MAEDIENPVSSGAGRSGEISIDLQFRNLRPFRNLRQFLYSAEIAENVWFLDNTRVNCSEIVDKGHGQPFSALYILQKFQFPMFVSSFTFRKHSGLIGNTLTHWAFMMAICFCMSGKQLSVIKVMIFLFWLLSVVYQLQKQNLSLTCNFPQFWIYNRVLPGGYSCL